LQVLLRREDVPIKEMVSFKLE